MLRQRVITATILVVVVLATLYLATSWAWGALSVAALWFAGREWERLILPARDALRAARGPALVSDGAAGAAGTAGSSSAADAAGTGDAGGTAAATPTDSGFPWMATGLVAMALVCLVWRESSGADAATPAAASWHAGWQSGLLVVDLLLWLLLAVPAVFRARPFPFGARSFAVVSLFCLWLGLYELRRIDPTLLLSTMAVIWVADVGAYFVGRAFGRRKLAPRVSPGKSWEGALGGLGLVLLLSVAAIAWLPATDSVAAVFPLWLADRAGLGLTVLVLVALVALSIIGDLHESLLKRARGVKDSGRLFPGHGGMLDRIDALVPTMPLALFVVQAVGQGTGG